MIKKFVVRLFALSCYQSVAAMDFREQSSRVHPIHCLQEERVLPRLTPKEKVASRRRKRPSAVKKGFTLRFMFGFKPDASEARAPLQKSSSHHLCEIYALIYLRF